MLYLGWSDLYNRECGLKFLYSHAYILLASLVYPCNRACVLSNGLNHLLAAEKEEVEFFAFLSRRLWLMVRMQLELFNIASYSYCMNL